MSQSVAKARTGKVDWADPGYFSGDSRVVNSVRVLVQMVKPPKGHRTLPTKTGTMLILITIGVGTAGFNTGQNILYLALSLLLSTLLVSGILSWLNFKGCFWRLSAGRHYRAKQPSPVYLELRNTKRWLPSYSLFFDLAASASGVRKVLPLEGRLDPGKETRLLWEFVPRRRGKDVLVLEGMVSRYPFGFLRKTIKDSYSKDIIVWPARIPYQFSGDKAGRRWLYGNHRRRGEGVELINVRGYKAGDPLRRIHWKASARMSSLQVRETEQEHHQAFSLWIEPSPAIWRNPIQFEKMCAFAASLAEDLFQRDQLDTCFFAGQEPIQVETNEDLYRVLDTLGQLEQEKATGVPKPGCIRFSPGLGEVVIANLEDQTVGQA